MWHEINGYTADSRNASCSMCGTAQRTIHRKEPERVFTTAIEIYMEGTVDLCEGCLAEGAALLGFVHPDVVDELKADLASYQAELHQARDEVEELTQQNAAFERVISQVQKSAPKPKNTSTHKDLRPQVPTRTTSKARGGG